MLTVQPFKCGSDGKITAEKDQYSSETQSFVPKIPNLNFEMYL